MKLKQERKARISSLKGNNYNDILSPNKLSLDVRILIDHVSPSKLIQDNIIQNKTKNISLIG